MILMSQDRKRIVDCVVAEVVRNLGGGKEAKYLITAGAAGINAGHVLGGYADEKTAMDELEKIYNAMLAGEKAYVLS